MIIPCNGYGKALEKRIRRRRRRRRPRRKTHGIPWTRGGNPVAAALRDVLKMKYLRGFKMGWWAIRQVDQKWLTRDRKKNKLNKTCEKLFFSYFFLVKSKEKRALKLLESSDSPIGQITMSKWKTSRKQEMQNYKGGSQKVREKPENGNLRFFIFCSHTFCQTFCFRQRAISQMQRFALLQLKHIQLVFFCFWLLSIKNWTAVTFVR